MPNDFTETLPDKLWPFYTVAQIGATYLHQLDYAAFMALVKPATTALASPVANGGPAAQRAICTFFSQLIETTRSVPLAWQRPFREAYDRGEIDGVTFGAAVRSIYRYHTPDLNYAGEAMAETLANLRLADPAGLMLPLDFHLWRKLLDHVTIYRGALTDTPAEAAQGISWTLSHGYAANHLYTRIMHATDIPAADIRATTDVLLSRRQGSPRRQLISAVVPKSIILAVMCSNDEEVFLDYEQIDPACIKSLPTSGLIRQGFMWDFRKMSMRLHAA